MELTLLRYFVTVAQELHFRRAAQKLNMTQGPLSSAIKKLEDELEVALFERSSRVVKLTAAGEFFLNEAQAVLQRAELAERNLKMKFSQQPARWAIGYNEPALNTVLPGLLRYCNQQLPDISLELRELETAEQITALNDGSLDMGLMRPYGFDLGNLQSQLVHQEQYLLAMAPDHPLAKQKVITAEMLKNQDVILFARDVNSKLFDLLCSKLTAPDGSQPNIKQSARTKRAMLTMVYAGFGAALLPESTLQGNWNDLKTAEVDLDLPKIDIMAVWNPANTSSILPKILNMLNTKK